MSIFAALTQISSATLTVVMGERLLFKPMLPGRNKASIDDPDRPQLEVAGAYREIVKRTKIDVSAVGRELNREVLAPVLTFSVDNALLGTSAFRAGDRIVRLDLPDEPVMEISAVEPDGGSRTIFTVVRVSA
ncbi:MAG TPA: hypothetical protein VNZ94_01770 [Xanthobacteraceae bacterium]|nr:hypothetical protein [Xanthobacteraceae bacterium]